MALLGKRNGGGELRAHVEGARRRLQEAAFSIGALLFLFGILGMTADFWQDALGAAAFLWCTLLGFL